MSYLGAWAIDDLLTFTCTTHTASTGAVTDADSVPTYRVYEDETGTAILNSSMAKLDDANTTGHYSEQITLSAANGFEKGKSYSIYIQATVASVAGAMTHNFQIQAAVDLKSIAGSAVSTSSAQLGVNVVNAAGTAWASGAITSGVFASGAITASAIAADAIGASELASDAVTEIVNGILGTAMTESYGTDGSTVTVAQALYILIARLNEANISSTTMTCKKLDGSTTAYTLTLNSASTPSTITRAT